MDTFRSLVLVATMAVALALPAYACTHEMVATNNDFGYIRGTPDRSGEQLWKLSAGAVVNWCGRDSTDREGITWHWVTFESQEEPWVHKGWMSSHILQPTEETGRSVDVGVHKRIQHN